VGVADAGDIHAHELEFGAEVGAGEGGIVLFAEMADGHPCHVVTGRDQAEDLLFPGCAFADGVDVGIAGAALVVDGHAAAGADGQQALAGEFVAGADAGREHDHVGFQPGPVGKHHAVPGGGAVGDLDGVAAGVDVHAQRFDLAAQHAAAAFVDLHHHQAGRELDHMRFQTEVAQGLGAFQAQQAAADHHAAARLGTRGLHGLEVFDGAVDKAVRTLAPRHAGHEGRRTGGQHQLVVIQYFAVGQHHGVVAAFDGLHTGVEAQGETGPVVEAGRHQREIVGAAAAEELREMDAVVGRAGLFAEHRHLQAGGGQVGVALDQFLEITVADHAVADDQQFAGCLVRRVCHATSSWVWRTGRARSAVTGSRVAKAKRRPQQAQLLQAGCRGRLCPGRHPDAIAGMLYPRSCNFDASQNPCGWGLAALQCFDTGRMWCMRCAKVVPMQTGMPLAVACMQMRPQCPPCHLISTSDTPAGPAEPRSTRISWRGNCRRATAHTACWLPWPMA